MAWVEDRWTVTVKNPDGSKTDKPSDRRGTGKRWRVRYETPDGRERARSFARKPDAERFRTTVEADLLRGTYLDPDAGKITLRKYAEQWLDAQHFDDASRESTSYRLSHIVRGLGDRRLDQLAASPSLVQSWLRGLKLAASTKRQCLTTLSSICAAAVDDGRMRRNPCRAQSVRAPELPRRKLMPLEESEIAALREAMPGRYRAMIDAGEACGLRQGEILGLAKEDIDFLRRTVRVERQVKIVAGAMVFALPKRGKTRAVPLADRAALAFAEHIASCPPVPVVLPWHEPGSRQHGKPVESWLLFTTPLVRKPMFRQRFNTNTWKPALKAAGIPVTRENGMHVLRHSFASALLSRGVDIRRLAAYLGHDDPGFTLRVYCHLMKDGDDQARQAIDASGPVPSPDQSGAEAQ